MAIRAVIWDLGGVLVRTIDHTPRRRWETRLGLEPNGLESIIFDSPVSRQASIGLAEPEAIWDWTAEQLGLSPEALAQLQTDFWAGDQLDEELVASIAGLRPAVKTGMITNAWKSIRPRIEEEWRLAPAFDDIVVSAEVGLAKPHPAIYRLALERLGVDVPETIFIDDFEENVAAARALGIHAIRFRDRDQVLRDLRPLVP